MKRNPASDSIAPVADRLTQGVPLSSELDRGMLVSALAFLAMHHESRRDEYLRDSHNAFFGGAVQVDCIRIADHHQKQLHKIREQAAILGGRNAYPRP